MPLTRVLPTSALFVVCAGAALAANGPFGVGMPEAAVATGGVFGWIAQYQGAFYKGLTAAIRALKSDPSAVATLAGLSFLYGVLHAAGPGHGKAVISAYVLANGETLRRGIALAFVSALVQALTAIVLIAAVAKALRLTAVAITDAAGVLELASGAMIAALGLVMLWRALRPVARREDCPPPRPALRYRGKVRVAAETCPDCGRMHIADPRLLAGPLTLRHGLAAVLAVGLRPCTGALIVLTFSFAQGLWWAGIFSALAMAAGTGLTVATLAALAVLARGLATRLAGADHRWTGGIILGLKVIAALAMLGLGLLILGAGWIGPATAG